MPAEMSSSDVADTPLTPPCPAGLQRMTDVTDAEQECAVTSKNLNHIEDIFKARS